MKHTREQIEKTLTVKAYIGDGKPTCACDFEKGWVCPFLGAKSFGCKMVCLATMEPVGNNRTGFMPVGDKCPIWREDETR